MKPTPWTRYLNVSAVPLAVLLVAGCGGGGGGGGVGTADGGIRGTGASVGPVSGFGSVFVNGIRFETDGNVASDDGISTEGELDKGMILRVEGQWRENGEGTADRVEYDDTFRGEIGDLDAITDPDDASVRESVTFTIYGQTIQADKQSVFKGVSLQTLAAGDFVRVSGWRLPDGSYRASYVGAVSDNPGNVEIEGGIDPNSVDVGLNRFRINSFLVTYDPNTTAFNGGLTVSDLQDPDVRVEVEGEVITAGGEPAIQATALERDETRRYQRSDGDDIEFAGPVATAFDSTTDTFTINGLTVVIPDSDVFDDGFTVNDLQPGLLVQVEGEFLADGRVEAEEIEIRDANAEVEGPISAASIDFQARTFRVGGVLVQVTPQTIISDDEGDDDDGDTRIDLADLNGNYELEVEGIERTDDNDRVFLEATKIEREEEDDEEDGEGSSGNEFELTGRLTDIDATTITVLGVRMQAEVGETEFDNVSRAQLEADFGAGERPVIEVEYSEVPAASGSFIADEVEPDDDDNSGDGGGEGDGEEGAGEED